MLGKFPQDIVKTLDISFPVERFGLYAIKITASCKSSSLANLNGGQDLRIEIDGVKLREIPVSKKPQYNNIPSAWNGSELKGLDKTITYILSLNKGLHSLSFIPTNGARVVSFEVTKLNELEKITFSPNIRAVDGDKRPWNTYALVNLPLRMIRVDASVSWHFFDGDDVKLIIDNEIQKNPLSKRQKYWAWSAEPWSIFTGAKREEKTFIKNLPMGVHYVEIWADKTPTLHKLILDFGDHKPMRIPDMIDPKWTGNFRYDSDVILLARLIFGEAENQSKEAKIWVGGSVLNRVNSSAWPNTIREVILQKGQYDPFKPSDLNFRKITDPLRSTSKQRVDAWNESYEVAYKLISEEFKNPSKATHFHGVGVTLEWFVENVVPQGKFLKQIDDTYFYWSPN